MSRLSVWELTAIIPMCHHLRHERDSRCGFGSRLFQKVRTELGLAYAVGGGIGASYDHPGAFKAEVLTKSPSTVDATKAALAESQASIQSPSLRMS